MFSKSFENFIGIFVMEVLDFVGIANRGIVEEI